jgi:prevent-host-death family protein
MTQIALEDAKKRLVELVEAVSRGEEFVITLEGNPVAKVTAAGDSHPARQFGSAAGQIQMSDDFDAPLDDFADYL